MSSKDSKGHSDKDSESHSNDKNEESATREPIMTRSVTKTQDSHQKDSVGKKRKLRCFKDDTKEKTAPKRRSLSKITNDAETQAATPKESNDERLSNTLVASKKKTPHDEVGETNDGIDVVQKEKTGSEVSEESAFTNFLAEIQSSVDEATVKKSNFDRPIRRPIVRRRQPVVLRKEKMETEKPVVVKKDVVPPRVGKTSSRVHVRRLNPLVLEKNEKSGKTEVVDAPNDGKLITQEISLELENLTVAINKKLGDSDSATFHLKNFKIAMDKKTEAEAQSVAEILCQRRLEELLSNEKSSNSMLLMKYLDLNEKMKDDFALCVKLCYLDYYDDTKQFHVLENILFGDSDYQEAIQVDNFHGEGSSGQVPVDPYPELEISRKASAQSSVYNPSGQPRSISQIVTRWPSEPSKTKTYEIPYEVRMEFEDMEQLVYSELTKNTYDSGRKIQQGLSTHLDNFKLDLAMKTEQQIKDDAMVFLNNRVEELMAIESKSPSDFALLELYSNLKSFPRNIRMDANINYLASYQGKPEFKIFEQKYFDC